MYGSSGIGEPQYAGAIYSPDAAGLAGVDDGIPWEGVRSMVFLDENQDGIDDRDQPRPVDAPVVELGLEYDPEPAAREVKWAGIPVWLVGFAALAWATNKYGDRIGRR